MGITNQRETTVVWDGDSGRPLHNAIVWLDTRTQVTVDKIVKEKGVTADHLKKLCGLPISTYFSALKLRWLLDHIPEVSACANLKFGTVDSWLIYNLTGGDRTHVTDVTTASLSRESVFETARTPASGSSVVVGPAQCTRVK